ncbi:MMPL family transporter [Catellatospora bangladeshensis]|uniref:Membrane protein n=1 Tax=Catellatospora bangladeshensis TaxID=310355 RepID=A0A8J3JSH6_9ACTN|nr:MMPL family transporter [Catellatospora bangladeshensis]GIF82984.1 membrane protein [Catellatospora bangladeshensis]
MGERFASWITSRIGAAVVLLSTVALSALVFLGSPDQPAAGPVTGLPEGRQSTRVTELRDRFPGGRAESALVVFERADAPLGDADRTAIETAQRTAAAVTHVGDVPPARFSDDGRAALLPVPFDAGLDAPTRNATVDELRAALRGTGSALPDGLTAQVTGGAAFGRDISAAFEGADVTLLAATAIVVALLLLVTYRSPFLWIVPLAVIGLGDQVTAKLLPWLGQLIGEPTDASIAGIVSVLVFGAGTDYALLLISRYREELRRTPDRRAALAAAVRAAGPAIVGSAGTVILALLTLLTAVLTSNRTLGLAAAAGVAVALVFGLVVLPAALAFLPRGAFWPLVPTVGSADSSATGIWARVAGIVGRHPRLVLAGATLVLAALSAGLLTTKIGLSQTEQFRTEVESVQAQDVLAAHFPAGSSQPLTVVANAAAADAVTATVRTTSGVAAVGKPEISTDGALVQLTAQLDHESGTPDADRTVTALRDGLAALDGAEALVGGQPAADLDQREANARDNAVVAPLVLGVVLLVLIVLLRSVVAPLLLLVTVVVSFAASLGAASLVFAALDIPALASSVPLLAFLFLVALGVDYNIFLVSRAREEAALRGDTRAGMLRALSATGGVITSAGVLLAAVFTVLGVLPVIVLTQLGIIVGVGVLLDTLLVRTLVVPALAMLLGERFWWPSRPSGRGPVNAPREPVAALLREADQHPAKATAGH